jgi:DNA-binding response OmpR family regulator
MAKILVIDDNADLLQMLRLILEERGNHHVTLSADGADGLSRALSSPPDLAIVDVMMPGITGYDVVRRMREQPQTATTPILILTARGQMIDRQTALRAGASDHMAKPVTPQVLLDKVDELLTSQKTRGAGYTDCHIISLLSLRGGVGVTTLAVNLALSGLQHQSAAGAPLRVCLVDFSPASGQATLHLRVKANRTWAQLPGLGNRPSADDLAELLTPHASRLKLLAAPFEPTHAGTLSAPLVEGTLNGLGMLFDLIVIDAPPLIDVVAAAALDSSDEIVLVLSPEVGAIQSTVAMLQVMDEMEAKVKVVLNRVSPQAGVPEGAIEKALRRPLALKVPYDPAQVSALPQGKPLAWSQPSSPLAAATKQLLAVLVP